MNDDIWQDDTDGASFFWQGHLDDMPGEYRALRKIYNVPKIFIGEHVRMNGSLIETDQGWVIDNPQSNMVDLQDIDAATEEEAKAVAMMIWRMS